MCTSLNNVFGDKYRKPACTVPGIKENTLERKRLLSRGSGVPRIQIPSICIKTEPVYKRKEVRSVVVPLQAGFAVCIIFYKTYTAQTIPVEMTVMSTLGNVHNYENILNFCTRK